MEINRKSWHWRLNCEYFRVISDRKSSFNYSLEKENYSYLLSEYMGNTLCSYFWGTVFRLVKIILALAAIYAFSGILSFGLIIGPVYTAIAQFQAGYFEFEPEYTMWTSILIFTFVASIIYLSHKASEFEGLVPEYVKARKNKFCPTLTVRK